MQQLKNSMLKLSGQHLYINGKIDFSNANDIYEQGKKLIEQSNCFPFIVHLEGLEQGSTVALAVFVRWLRLTPHLSGLHFESVPNKMMKIIESCHLEHDLLIKKAS